MNNNNWDHMKRGVISAGAAVSEQIFFGSFLDMLKIEKQRNINNSYPKIGKTFFQKKGVRALTLGFWPWGLIMYSGRGICFGFANGLSNSHLSQEKYSYLTENKRKIMAGFMGGAFEGAMTSPIVMMRTRVAEQAMGAPKASFNVRQALKAVPLKDMIKLRKLIKECEKSGGKDQIKKLYENDWKRDYKKAKSMASWTSTHAMVVLVSFGYYFAGKVLATKPGSSN